MSPPRVPRWLPPVTLSGLIALLSLVPGDGRIESPGAGWLVSITPAALQKALHVLLYAALTVAWCSGLRAVPGVGRRNAAAACLAVGLGALLEVLQTVVPGRYGSATDVLINAAGAAVGLLLARIYLSETKTGA